MCFSWRGNSSFKDISAFLFCYNSLLLENLAFLLNRQKEFFWMRKGEVILYLLIKLL